MEIFGLVITTKEKLREREVQVQLSTQQAMDESLKAEREYLNKYRKCLREQELEVSRLKETLLKEIEEARADLILRELAKVMGGRWDGVRI